jgi:hypothetical protein
MPLIAPKPSNADFTPAPAGTHLAICYRLIDLGTQLTTYQGQPPRPQHKIVISWELPEARMADGQPYTVHQRYTFSLHKQAALRADLESWRGRPFTDEELEAFDLERLLGQPCMLSIVHRQHGDRTHAHVTAVTRLPKGMAAPDRPTHQPVAFSLATPDWRVFQKLSLGLQEAIKRSPEYAEATRQPMADAPPERRGDIDDDIPF